MSPEDEFGGPRLDLPAAWLRGHCRNRAPDAYADDGSLWLGRCLELSFFPEFLDDLDAMGVGLEDLEEDLSRGLSLYTTQREGFFDLVGWDFRLRVRDDRERDTDLPIAIVVRVQRVREEVRREGELTVPVYFADIRETHHGCELPRIQQAVLEDRRLRDEARRTLYRAGVQEDCRGRREQGGRLSRDYGALESLMDLLEQRARVDQEARAEGIVVPAAEAAPGPGEEVSEPLIVRTTQRQGQFQEEGRVRLTGPDGAVYRTELLEIDGDLFRFAPLDGAPLRPGDAASIEREMRFNMRQHRECLRRLFRGEVEGDWDDLVRLLCDPASLQPVAAPPVDQFQFFSDREQPLNAEQKKAVVGALTSPHAYFIQGPPGTGKTTVIVELVRQAVARGERVLLLAPTHVAVDEVLRRAGAKPGILALRLSWDDRRVHEDVRCFTLRHFQHEFAARLRRPAGSRAEKWQARLVRLGSEMAAVQVLEEAPARLERTGGAYQTGAAIAEQRHREYRQWREPHQEQTSLVEREAAETASARETAVEALARAEAEEVDLGRRSFDLQARLGHLRTAARGMHEAHGRAGRAGEAVDELRRKLREWLDRHGEQTRRTDESLWTDGPRLETVAAELGRVDAAAAEAERELAAREARLSRLRSAVGRLGEARIERDAAVASERRQARLTEFWRERTQRELAQLDADGEECVALERAAQADLDAALRCEQEAKERWEFGHQRSFFGWTWRAWLPPLTATLVGQRVPDDRLLPRAGALVRVGDLDRAFSLAQLHRRTVENDLHRLQARGTGLAALRTEQDARGRPFLAALARDWTEAERVRRRAADDHESALRELRQAFEEVAGIALDADTHEGELCRYESVEGMLGPAVREGMTALRRRDAELCEQKSRLAAEWADLLARVKDLKRRRAELLVEEGARGPELRLALVRVEEEKRRTEEERAAAERASCEAFRAATGHDAPADSDWATLQERLEAGVQTPERAEELLGSPVLGLAAAAQRRMDEAAARREAAAQLVARLSARRDELARRRHELAEEARRLEPPLLAALESAVREQERTRAERDRAVESQRKALAELGLDQQPSPDALGARRDAVRAEQERLDAFLRLEQRWFELTGMTTGGQAAADQIAQTVAAIAEDLKESANLICATTTGVAGGLKDLRRQDFDLLIVDEASRVTDAEFLIGAVRARRLILVGDEHQLPPYVEQADEHHLHALAALHRRRRGAAGTLEESVEQLGKIWEEEAKEDGDLHRYRQQSVLEKAQALDGETGVWESRYREGFEKAYTRFHAPEPEADKDAALLAALRRHLVNSLFERCVRRCPPELRQRLVWQRRMIAPIAAIVRDPVYAGEYQTPPEDELRRAGLRPLPRTPTFTHPILFFDTSSQGRAAAEEPDGSGFVNPLECEWMHRVCTHYERELCERDEAPVSISILCFYRSQARRVRDLLGGPDIKRRFHKLEFKVIDAIDKIQGQESDLVFLSFTRSRPFPGPEFGQWLQDLRRLNVACTRARRGLAFFGHAGMLRRLATFPEARRFYANLFDLFNKGGADMRIIYDLD